MPHITFSQNNTDYDTQFGNSKLQVGSITFTSVAATNVAGTFNGKLSTEDGRTITLTEGKFNVLLKKF